MQMDWAIPNQCGVMFGLHLYLSCSVPTVEQLKQYEMMLDWQFEGLT